MVHFFFYTINKLVDASSMPDPILGTLRRIQFLEQTFMEQKLEAIMKIQKSYKGDRFRRCVSRKKQGAMRALQAK